MENENNPENLSSNDLLDEDEDNQLLNTRKRLQPLDNESKASKKIKSKNTNNNSNTLDNNVNNDNNDDVIESIHLKIVGADLSNTKYNFSNNINQNNNKLEEIDNNEHGINYAKDKINYSDLQNNEIYENYKNECSFTNAFSNSDDLGKHNITEENNSNININNNNNIIAPINRNKKKNELNRYDNLNNIPDLTDDIDNSPNNNNNNNNNKDLILPDQLDWNDFDIDGIIAGGIDEENISIAHFNSFIDQKPSIQHNNSIQCSNSSEEISQNIGFNEKGGSGIFYKNSSKESLETLIFDSTQEFEFLNKNYYSLEFHQTMKFPPDIFVCLDDPFKMSYIDDCIEETPRSVGRQDNVPVDILKKDTLSKIGILKSNSPMYGDVFIIYDDLYVDSHDHVGSNFLMFGRSSQNSNMSFASHKISSKHCKIYVIRDILSDRYEVWIEDTSSNGTYVNRELVGRNNKRMIKPDDTLHLYIPESSEEDEEISYVLKEMVI